MKKNVTLASYSDTTSFTADFKLPHPFPFKAIQPVLNTNKRMMKKIWLILLLLNFAAGKIHGQSFSVNDLVTLASLQSKNINRFMNKHGLVANSKLTGDTMVASFGVKIKGAKKNMEVKSIIDIYLKDDSKYFTLQTASSSEYLEGQRGIIKSGFFYDDKKDVSKEPSMLFQKGNIKIYAISRQEDGIPRYNFKLQVRQIPSTIKYAEDLLQFDSHEFLVSYFGEKNVKKDMYYFSENELKKCSVLFSGTRYQVVFVWGDQNNLIDIVYILIPHKLPTAGADNDNAITGNNEWQFKNGIYPGMGIKELLRLNEIDFDIYGNTSELAFMVKPEENGRIDFNKTAVMLSCDNCNSIKIFNQKVVSALDIAKQDLPVYVNDVVLYPSHR
ncbi:MAG: hypothetical protein ABJA71_05025 [Ginsengibacter sp.]